jgi:DNA-binding NarL/FixJ family response regulator
MPSLRILIADDHHLVRRGVKALLLGHAGWDVCAEAATGREAVAKAKQLKPDIAILDIGMPELNGLDAAREIRTASPKTKILILSVHRSDQLIREVVDAGIRGYLVKSDAERDLILAVESLANHKPFYTPLVTESILERFNAHASAKTVLDPLRGRLTPREREVVQLIAEGRNSKDVALSLGISQKTAETHRANIMRKLDIHTVSELVRYALRNEIIEG